MVISVNAVDRLNLAINHKTTDHEKNDTPVQEFAKLLDSTENSGKNAIGLEIPDWVNTDYHYDPKNPRKPNFRELVEAMAGQSLEQMNNNAKSELDRHSKQAHELLYGVVQSSDTRNWEKIMSSSDILGTAQKETGLMHEPRVDIKTELDIHNNVTTQSAVLVDKSGTILRTLDGNKAGIVEILETYGATPDSVPDSIESKITVKDFDKEVLNALTSFGKREPEPPIFDLITNKISKKIEQFQDNTML